MKSKAVIILLLICLLAGCSAKNDKPTDTPLPTTARLYSQILNCNFFDQVSFDMSVKNAKKLDTESMSAGIVNHHLLAGDLIASFFKTAAEVTVRKEYKTIFIIAPNHKGIGPDITVSDKSWKTAFGVVDSNKRALEGIMNSGLGAKWGDKIIESDHSASVLIPYIKYYLPKAEVVPILLTRGVSLAQTKALTEQIKKFADSENCLVVGSSDFSHYLSPDASEVNDRETLKAIEEFDFNQIDIMTNDNVDSPETVTTILYYLKSIQKESIRMLAHKATKDYVKFLKPGEYTTYFVFAG